MRREFAEVKMIALLKKLERDVPVLVLSCSNVAIGKLLHPFSQVGRQVLFFISQCLKSDLRSCLQNPRIQVGNPRIQVGYPRGGPKMYRSAFKKDSMAEKIKAR